MHELVLLVLCIMAWLCRDHGKKGNLKFVRLPKGSGTTSKGKMLNVEGAERGPEVLPTLSWCSPGERGLRLADPQTFVSRLFPEPKSLTGLRSG